MWPCTVSATILLVVFLIGSADGRVGMSFSCSGQWEPLHTTYADYCSKLCNYCHKSNPGDDEPKFGCMAQHGTDYCMMQYDCNAWTAVEGTVNSMKDFCVQQACGQYCKYDQAVDMCMLSHYQQQCKKVGSGTHIVTPAPTAAPTPSPTGSSCFAMSGWGGNSECRLCPTAAGTGGSCVEFGYTKCTPSMQDCGKQTSGTACWAPNAWSGATCELCTKTSGGACSGFGWTKCYTSKDQCEKEDLAVGNNGASAGCKDLNADSCPKNTLEMMKKRPSFKGPNCYDSTYGPQFGVDWKPTGKTNFEKYIRTPGEMLKVIFTNPQMPLLNHWGLEACDATTAVFENLVCALELLDHNGKLFAGPRADSPGSKVSEFAGSSDDDTNRRELAAFFSHKFKETGQLTTWEELNDDPTVYRSPNYAFNTKANYHGRGPVQISWNYNYGDFSQWYFNNKQVLLDDPDKVDPEGPMGFISALWFWFTPRQFTSGAPIAGTLRTRDAIVHWTDGQLNGMYKDGKDYDSVAGLALSTNVINGGIECLSNADSAKYRVEYYLHLAGKLGVKIPSMELLQDKDKCLADKLCRGLYAGCSTIAKGLTCKPAETKCGLSFISGWSGRNCEW